MKPRNQTLSRPMIICATRMNTMAATIVVIPGMALAGENEINEKMSISEANDLRPSCSTAFSTATLSS